MSGGLALRPARGEKKKTAHGARGDERPMKKSLEELRALENRLRRWSKTVRRRRESEMRARESLENDERERERVLLA